MTSVTSLHLSLRVAHEQSVDAVAAALVRLAVPARCAVVRSSAAPGWVAVFVEPSSGMFETGHQLGAQLSSALGVPVLLVDVFDEDGELRLFVAGEQRDRHVIELKFDVGEVLFDREREARLSSGELSVGVAARWVEAFDRPELADGLPPVFAAGSAPEALETLAAVLQLDERLVHANIDELAAFDGEIPLRGRPTYEQRVVELTPVGRVLRGS